MCFYLLLLLLAVPDISSVCNALQLSFSSITAVRTPSGSYYFLTFQVNSAFLSWTIRVIAKIKPKCHDWAECHQMAVSHVKLLFLHSKPTVILFCKYYRGVYYCFHLFILLYHIRVVFTGESGLCCALSTSKGQRN